MTSPMNESEWVSVCTQEDVLPGQMRAVEHPDFPPIAIFNVDGVLHATSNICTHNIAILTDGELSGSIVECPLHGGAFDVTSGEAVAFPCESALKKFPVAVVNGNICLAGRSDSSGDHAQMKCPAHATTAVPDNSQENTVSAATVPVTMRIADSSTTFQVLPGDTVLQGALRAGIGFPYECSSGGCGSCMMDVSQGDVMNLWPEAPGLSEKARVSGKRLACQCQPAGDCEIKVKLAPHYVPPIRPERRKVVWEKLEMLTPDMALIRFKGEGPAKFLPGQYALLTLPGQPQVRAYSMANLANKEGYWDFIIKRVDGGYLSTRLHGLKERSFNVILDGPYGTAFLNTESERDVLCIAGGAGLSPMVSILRGAATEVSMSARRLHLFYGGRTALDMCDAALVAGDPYLASRVQCVSAISSTEDASGQAWSGERGFVHEIVAKKIGKQVSDYEIYLSGPTPMVDAVQRMLLLDYKVPSSQIHFDRFS